MDKLWYNVNISIPSNVSNELGTLHSRGNVSAGVILYRSHYGQSTALLQNLCYMFMILKTPRIFMFNLVSFRKKDWINICRISFNCQAGRGGRGGTSTCCGSRNGSPAMRSHQLTNAVRHPSFIIEDKFLQLQSIRNVIAYIFKVSSSLIILFIILQVDAYATEPNYVCEFSGSQQLQVTLDITHLSNAFVTIMDVC